MAAKKSPFGTPPQRPANPRPGSGYPASSPMARRMKGKTKK